MPHHPDPAEPVSELRHIPIREVGEPLVDFLKECPDLLQDRPRFNYRRETLVRKSVAESLGQANQILLSQGYRLLIIEGWRAPVIQQRMFRAIERQFQERYPDLQGEALRTLVEQFSAPMDETVPPPHTTGGAVDVILGDRNGRPLDLNSPFDLYDDKGFAFDAQGLSNEARANRDRMAAALIASGLTNYPSEYWHWSYGDQGWAYRGGHPEARYAAITPPGWRLAPEDESEEALEFLSID
jgi:D-alanyl-D-alanine dipeptidase